MAGNTENGVGHRGSRWRIAAWGVAAALILLPLLAMKFTNEVAWDLADFVFACALVLVIGGTYELVGSCTSMVHSFESGLCTT